MKKKHMTTSLIVILLCISSFLHSQTTVCQGDTVYFSTTAYRGDIQWQESVDSVQWNDIPGATTDTLVVIAAATSYYRAAVTEGTCLPVYSDVELLDVDPCAVFVCGNILTVTHTIGSVAPETKTVNYGTVLSNLTGSNKCWITQNLGSSIQAVTALDTTNAAAGWYWQFNRIQGYINGSPSPTTPAWTVTSINELLDWLPANDPCTSELGPGWRLPTQTEWASADAAGGWNSITDAYNSVLKLHAAGRLNGSTGALEVRTLVGGYWSGTRSSATYGWALLTHAGGSAVGDYVKPNGYPIRCLKD